MNADEQPRSFGERVADIRERVVQLVEAHPWELVGGAALFGAWLGFAPPRQRRTRIGEVFVAAAGALAIRLVREAAFRQLGQIALRWWDESGLKVGADREPEAGRENGRSDRSHPS